MVRELAMAARLSGGRTTGQARKRYLALPRGCAAVIL